MALEDITKKAKAAAFEAQVVAGKAGGIIGENEITDNQVKVLQKMGFSTLDQARFFDAEQSRNPELKAMLQKYEGDFANTAKYDRLLESIGKRFLEEGARADYDVAKAGSTPTIMDALGQDVKGDGGKRLDAALKAADPKVINGLAANLPSYQTGKLDQVLTVAGAPALPAPAPAPAPAATKPEAKPAAAPAVAKPAPPGGSAPTAPAAEPRPDPVRVAAPAPSEAPASPPPAAAKPVDAAKLANMSDEQLSTLLKSNPNMVKDIGESIAQFAEKNYPDTIGRDANKLRSSINSSPELRQKIADNLAQNPAFVRSMAQLTSEGGVDMNKPMVRNFVETSLKTIISNPDKLADKSYTDRLQRQAQAGTSMSNGMDQLTSYLRTMGFDSRAMGNMSNFFDGLGRQCMDIMNRICNGQGLVMGNGRGNGLFGGITMGWTQAGADVFLAQYSDVKGRPGAKGPVSDGTTYEIVEKPGQPARREAVTDPERDHRISVQTLDSKEPVKVFITSGLSPVRDREGNYNWTLATKVDGSGQPIPSSMKTYRLDAQQSQQLYQTLTQAGATNIKDPSTMGAFRETPQAAGPDMLRVDAATGRVSPDTVKPVAPVPGIQPGLQVDGAPLQRPEIAPGTVV